jgi:hypothetical protein
LRLTGLGAVFLSKNMLKRFKKVQKFIDRHLSKEQFLEEHNRLSPACLGATIALLTNFKLEKSSLFKDDNWSIDKLRRPFIFWLTSLKSEEKAKKQRGVI